MAELSDDDRAWRADQASYMNGWTYGSLLYKERGDDPEWLMREALRRAVDSSSSRGQGPGLMG